MESQQNVCVTQIKENRTPQTLEEFKKLGNEYFIAKEFRKALKYYTNGLAKFSHDVDLLSNRCACYINLERFYLGLADADGVLQLNCNHSKAIYRKTKCLAGLKCYHEAAGFLNDKLQKKQFKGNEKELRQMLTHIRSLCFQAETGIYDIVSILESPPHQKLDIAEYVGPLKIIPIFGKGRGMVATKPIVPGQLIMASKAFALAFADASEIPSGNYFGDKLPWVLISMASRKLICNIENILQEEPEHMKQIYNLYAGPEFEGKEGTDEFCKVDVCRIQQLCIQNCFCRNELQLNANTNQQFNGLWVQPSYINHSCFDCNCTWSVYGDFMFIRAYRHIDVGEEVTISYINPMEPYEEREKFWQYHGFVCNCSLCLVERSISKISREKRDDMIKGYDSRLLKKLECTIQELETMNAEFPILNFRHEHMIFSLACGYINAGKSTKAIDLLEKCYKILKTTPLTHTTLITAMEAIKCLGGIKGTAKEAKDHWIRKWLKCAKVAYGSEEVLKYFEKYPEQGRRAIVKT